MKYFCGMLMVLLLAACQDRAHVSSETHESKPVVKEESKASDDNDQTFDNLPCVNQSSIKKSPPIKDKSKIQEMLLKSGKITADMTPQQIEKAVNSYIRNKNAAFNDCGKKG
ncbi:hypothetical protein [Thalassotalea profundi]|uniref:Lipoprotein n=1 Tax=Thalassotalea profundi TaxID=2036687 RepID=A0ABQ3J0Z4_9GAMM|nr:hypothetical protein [Thalassotalea profundi]GHE97501.1 hypothetical protein GCM10011501_28870 [Thalassotalea profundi]